MTVFSTIWKYCVQYERVLFMTGQTWLENAHPLKLVGFSVCTLNFTSTLYYKWNTQKWWYFGVNKSDELRFLKRFYYLTHLWPLLPPFTLLKRLEDLLQYRKVSKLNFRAVRAFLVEIPCIFTLFQAKPLSFTKIIVNDRHFQ